MAGGVNVNLTANVQQFQTAMRQAEQNLTRFEQSAKRTAAATNEIAMPAAASFAALTLGVAAATRAFGDFEAVLNSVRAVSGASAEEVGRLKQQALELGAATQYSAKEAAQGMAELAKAGFTVQQVSAAIPGVLALAAAGGVSVAEAAEAAGAALNGFGLEADKAGKVADILAKASNLSAIGVGDLQNSLKYVAPLAAQTSQSIEEVSTALVIMGNAGIKSEQAGTTLRSALTSLVKPSDDAAQKLNALKISIQDTHGRMLPLTDIIGQLRTATASMTEVQRANAIAMIFGQESVSGILAIMKQAPSAIDATSAAVRNNTDAAKDMAAVMNSGLKGAIEQATGAMDTAATMMGEEFAPSIIAVAKGVQSLAEGYSKLDPGTKTLIAGTVAAAIAMTGMVAALGSLGAIAPVVIAGVGFIGASIGPVALTVAGLSAAVGVLTMVLKANADAAAANAAATAKANQERRAAADAAIRHKDELAKLVAEHDRLVDSAGRSKEEEARLKAIMEQVKGISPELATALGGLKDTHWANAQAVLAHNKQLAQNIALQRKALQAAIVVAGVNVRRKAMNVDTDAGVQRAKVPTLTGKNPVAGVPTPDEFKAELKRQTTVFETSKEARELAAAKDALAAFDKMVATGGTPKVDDLDRGGAFPPPSGHKSSSRHSSGKTDAQREAEEEARLVNEIAEMYRQAADAKAEAMQTGNNMATMEAEEFWATEEAEIEAASEAYAESQRQRVQDMLAANTLVEQAGWELAESLDAATRHGIREMQGAIVALATDPSLERVANFAQSIAADEDKMARWGQTLDDIGQAFARAGGGAQGFGAALKVIGTSIDPVSLGLTAIIGLAQAIKGAFEEATEAQETLRESALSTAMAIREAEANISGDPRLLAEVERDKARAQLNRGLLAEVKKRKDALIVGPEWMSHNSVTSDTFGKDPHLSAVAGSRLSDLTIDNFTDIKRRQGLELEKLDRRFEEAIAKTGGAGDIARQMRSDGLVDEQQRMESLHDSLDQSVDRLAEIRKELNEGGRDDWGRKITLEQEKQNRLLKQQEENAKRLNTLTERKLKMEEDLRQLDIDAAKAIRDIENEGIAVRAVTESQDKAARIEKVQADYAKKRKELTRDIADATKDIASATLEAEQALSRINFQYQERLSALDTEWQKMTANVQLAQQQLGIERSITEEINRRTYAAATSGGGSGLSSGATYGSTGTTYHTRYFHTGGSPRALKPGEVPIVAKEEEFILTPRQMNNLLAAAARGSSPVSPGIESGIAAMVNRQQQGWGYPGMSPSQMLTNQSQMVSLGDIHVHAAPGMNERDLANRVMGVIDQRLRRAGLGR